MHVFDSNMRLQEVSEFSCTDECSALRNIYLVIPNELDLKPLLDCYEDNCVPLPAEHLAGKLVRLLGMPSTDDEDWDGRVHVVIVNPFDFSSVEPAFLLPLPSLVEANPDQLRALYDASGTDAQQQGQPEPDFICEGTVDDASIPDDSNYKTTDHAKSAPVKGRARVEVVESISTNVPNHEHGFERHRESEQYMVMHLASETLQDAWRRYQDCAPAKRLIRRLRHERLAHKMAADTIKTAIQRYVVIKRKPNPPQAFPDEVLAPEAKPLKPTEPDVDWDTYPLPTGWERRVDNERNRIYYVDHNTRKTQWKHPLFGQHIASAVKEKAAMEPVHEPSEVVVSSTSLPPHPEVVPSAPALSARRIVHENGGRILISSSEHVVPSTSEAVSKPTAEVQEPSHKPSQPPLQRRPSHGASSAITNATAPTEATSGSGSSSKRHKTHRRKRSRHVDWIVLDEAHADALAAQTRRVVFSASEAVKLLDALDCELSVEAIGPGSTQILAGVPPLHLPLSHEQSLAASLTAYARANFLVKEPRLFSLTEAQATLATQRLHTLVDGSWLHSSDGNVSCGVRAVILEQCAGILGRNARPSLWGTRAILRVLNVLGMPTDRAEATALDGSGFLQLSVASLSDIFTNLPALLQARVRILQHTLQLVDQWWGIGHRPGDIWREASSGTLAALQTPFIVTPDPANASIDKTNKRKVRKHKDSKSLACRQGWGIDVPVDVVNNGVIAVELAPQEALLQAWMPLNRAYGWGIPLETLSIACSRLGSARALLDLACLEPQPSASDALDAPIGYVWVRVEDIQGTELLELCPSQLVRPESPSGFAEALVPLSCVRKASLPTKSVTSHAALDPNSLFIGAQVRIAERTRLLRACERFEWWDRPPAEVLNALAGQTAIVVALTDASTRGRVGVRLPTSGVLDAVPLEALSLDRKTVSMPISNIVSTASPTSGVAAVDKVAIVPAPALATLPPAAGAPEVTVRKNKRALARSAALRGGVGPVPMAKPAFLEHAKKRLLESEKTVSNLFTLRFKCCCCYFAKY